METGVSHFLASRTALGRMIYIVIDLQLDTYLYSTMAQFLGAAEDKQPFLHPYMKQSISHKQKPPVKLSRFEAF